MLLGSKHLNACKEKMIFTLAIKKNNSFDLKNYYCAVFKVHTKIKFFINFLNFATFYVLNQSKKKNQIKSNTKTLWL